MVRPTVRQLWLKLKKLVTWESFASNLGIEQHEIQIIKRQNPLDINSQKQDLFDLWLRTDTTASWEKVEKALSDSGETVLAKEISLYISNGYADQEEENSAIPELPQVPNKPLPSLDDSTEDTDHSSPAANNISEGNNNASDISEANNNISEGNNGSAGWCVCS